jgi:hypothetical protein
MNRFLAIAGRGRSLGFAAALLLLTGGCRDSPWLAKENPVDAMYDLRGSGISRSELPAVGRDPELLRQYKAAANKNK